MSPRTPISFPATARNRDPILAVLGRVLPASGTGLEVASGSGEHAAYFAPRLPHLVWQPSDPEPQHRDSIAAWAARAAVPNPRPPLDLDTCTGAWPAAAAAVVCINMIHIAPWAAAEGLMAGAGALLPAGAPLYIYGPFRRDGRHTAPSNAAFDRSLRAENPDWGVRDLEAVTELGEHHGFTLAEVVEMPANNLSVILTHE